MANTLIYVGLKIVHSQPTKNTICQNDNGAEKLNLKW